MNVEDSEFERRLRALLEESTDRLGGRVRSRLTQARHAALAAQRAAPAAAWRHWAPAGAIAASALLAMIVLSNRGGLPSRVEPLAPVSAAEAPTALDDLELLADNDGIELANSDELDFYEWAASEASRGEAVGS